MEICLRPLLEAVPEGAEFRLVEADRRRLRDLPLIVQVGRPHTGRLRHRGRAEGSDGKEYEDRQSHGVETISD
jgi:hypothetical protein